ncbi:MAG: hypothetical protein F6K17_15265 [Okeania sp. SIO3C4]|nr:hypothetical protein [Okeania sp. SIO3C4]
MVYNLTFCVSPVYKNVGSSAKRNGIQQKGIQAREQDAPTTVPHNKHSHRKIRRW